MKKSVIIFLLFIFISNDLVAQSPLSDRLIGDFYQTIVAPDKKMKKCIHDNKWGNCVAIALIKAAIAEFKTIENIYKSYRLTDDKIIIIFNDGLEIEVTANEIESARKFSAFGRGNNSVYYDSAIIVYASICKRILVYKKIQKEENKKCINNFEDAMYFINSGYSTEISASLLGLHFVSKNLNDLGSLESAIIRTSAHTAFCTQGVQDISGNRFIVHDGLMKNPASGPRPIKGIYILAK